MSLRHPPGPDHPGGPDAVPDQTSPAWLGSIDPLLEDAGLLLVVPPFASAQWPSLAAHSLQAGARRDGLKVHVLYLNLVVAAALGEADYAALCTVACSTSWLREGLLLDSALAQSRPGGTGLVAELLARFEGHIDVERCTAFFSDLPAWLDQVTRCICTRPYRAVGCSATYAQTLASVAVLQRIKQQRPEIVTLIGGAACEGPMAEGVMSLSPALDLVCSGHWENAVAGLVTRAVDGELSGARLQVAPETIELEALPPPVYADYYAQARLLLPEESLGAGSMQHLPYETSRGCWRGQHHACRFCGLNGPALTYTERAPDTAVADLSVLLKEHPTRIVMLTDNVLPSSAPSKLLPRLADALPDLVICAQVRTHHRLPDILAMRRAGLQVAQAGVEALSTSLLRRMRKGVTARQNLTFLRNIARVGGLTVFWNLLYDVPGDTEQDYRQTLELIPRITHLPPPLLLAPLVIERFSPYFEEPASFGITGLRQCQYPPEHFPEHVDLDRLASHFTADYECFSTSDHPLMTSLRQSVEAWRAGWTSTGTAPPRLELTRLELTRSNHERYMLLDTRPASPAPGRYLLPRERAAEIVSDHRLDHVGGPDRAWARSHQLCVEADGWNISVVVAAPELVLELGHRPSGPLAQTTGM